MEEEEDHHADRSDSRNSSQESRPSAFLQQIARQSVEFETDSDAADSWAQEPPDKFELELQRHARTLQSLQRQLEQLQVNVTASLQ